MSGVETLKSFVRCVLQEDVESEQEKFIKRARAEITLAFIELASACVRAHEILLANPDVDTPTKEAFSRKLTSVLVSGYRTIDLTKKEYETTQQLKTDLAREEKDNVELFLTGVNLDVTFESARKTAMLRVKFIQRLTTDLIDSMKEFESSLGPIAAPEAPVDAEWGAYAFGHRRGDVPYEPNTPEENDAQHELQNHFDGSDFLSSKLGNKIKKFIDDEQYTKLLKFPINDYHHVYRGMGMHKDDLLGLLSDDAKADKEKITKSEVGEPITIDANVIAKPRARSASWSVSKGIAREFSSASAKKFFDQKDIDIWCVVLIAETSDNADVLVLNPDTIYSVKSFSDYSREREVIAVGPIKVSKLELIRFR